MASGRPFSVGVIAFLSLVVCSCTPATPPTAPEGETSNGRTPNTLPAAKPAPGALQEVVISDIAGSEVIIRFRFCPSGSFFPGDPREPNDVQVDFPDGFFISECDITQKQFATIVGFPKYNEIRMRARDNKFGDEFSEVPSSNPIFLLSFAEASEFCRKLKEKAELTTHRGVPVVFRLPSHHEWQYACRAGDPESRHFNGWLRSGWADVPVDTGAGKGAVPLRKLGQQLWEQAGCDGQFSGTQDDVLQILEASQNWPSPDKADALLVLTAFLQEVLAEHVKLGADSSADGRSLPPCYSPDGQPSGHGNSWHIFQMHTNVVEWVFAPRPSRQESDWWEALESSPGTAGELGTLGTVGGSFKTSRYWREFLIWSITPYDEVDDAALGVNSQAGIRVVIEVPPWGVDSPNAVTVAGTIETSDAL